MRFVIYGAGAVGGVLGARLAQAGHDVVLIARGAHLAAIQADGLRLDSPGGSQVLPVPAVAGPEDVEIGRDDVVVLTMKGNDTQEAVQRLRAVADPATPVVCLQNGVANERVALRLFANVYSVCVMFPATHLEPGVVRANSAPITGLLDIGCYPTGLDERANQIAAAFEGAAFVSQPRADIMRWKYRKLLGNLGNAVQAACGTDGDGKRLLDIIRQEGSACLRAAGIDVVSEEEDRERRGDLLQVQPVNGEGRSGGSSWQSLRRATGSIESDYLNGEIVLLGRLHGVPTPANELIRQVAVQLARDRQPPGSLDAADLLARL